MSFALLAPLGLAALAAWVLPLLIHLVRRVELETTPFAALRWIGTRIQPQRRLRFERPWLLLVRLLLLGLLALLLARLALEATTAAPTPRVYVAPGVDRGAALAAVDSSHADWRWLAPAFPRFEETLAAGVVPLASLLREADAQLPDGETLQVVVPQQLAGLDGERARLVHALEWHVVAGAMPASPNAEDASPIRAVVRYAKEDAASVRYVEAAVAAWNVREPGRYRLDADAVGKPIPDDASWLLWLAPTPPRDVLAWIERGGRALLAHAGDEGDALWRDAHGDVVARDRRIGAGHAIVLPDALAPDRLPQLLDPGFPERLRVAFAGTPPAPDRAAARAMAPALVDGGAVHSARSLAAARPLDAWLALAIAVLFALERIVATARRPEPRA